MRSFFLLCIFFVTGNFSFAQVTISGSVVPKFIQGLNGTNSTRMPFAFYGQFSGMLPNSWYRYFTALDTFGSINNGGGNAWLLNKISGTVRRSTTSTLNNVVGYDSVYTDAAGNYGGWFMVEATGNARFKPGNKIYPMVFMNDGQGGIASVNRMRFLDDTVTVLNFGTGAGDTLQCSAVWDSANAPAKSFVLLYDNISGSGRPLAASIVEDDGLYLSAVSTFSSTYKTQADSLNFRWCTIMPNANTDGVKRIEYRDWSGDSLISFLTDSNAIWCSGVNTIDPSFGHTGVFLNSLIQLQGSLAVPDTVALNASVNYSSTSNVPNTSWDFGDTTAPVSGQTVTHTYTSGGWHYITATMSGDGCSINITDSVYVDVTLSKEDLIIRTFQVYPNPASSSFIIHPSDNQTLFDLFITDVNGSKLKCENEMKGSKTINTADLSPGLYLLRLVPHNGRTTCIKLMIL